MYYPYIYKEYLCKKNDINRDILVSTSNELNRAISNYSTFKEDNDDSVLIWDRPLLVDLVSSHDASLPSMYFGETIPINTLCLYTSLDNKKLDDDTQIDYEFLNRPFITNEGYKRTIQLTGNVNIPPDVDLEKINQVLLVQRRFILQADGTYTQSEYGGFSYLWIDPAVFNLDRTIFSPKLSQVNEGCIFDISMLMYLIKMNSKMQFKVFNNGIRITGSTETDGMLLECDVLTNNQLVMDGRVSANNADTDKITLKYDVPRLLSLLYQNESATTRKHFDFNIRLTQNTGTAKSWVLPVPIGATNIDVVLNGLPSTKPIKDILFDNVLKCSFSGFLGVDNNQWIQIYSNYRADAGSGTGQQEINNESNIPLPNNVDYIELPGTEVRLTIGTKINIETDLYLRAEDLQLALNDPDTFKIRLNLEAQNEINAAKVISLQSNNGVIISWQFAELFVLENGAQMWGSGVRTNGEDFNLQQIIGHCRVHCLIDLTNLEDELNISTTSLYLTTSIGNLSLYSITNQITYF